jgi:hypothetical protein
MEMSPEYQGREMNRPAAAAMVSRLLRIPGKSRASGFDGWQGLSSPPFIANLMPAA